MRHITLDFETYYSRDYSLSKMTTVQYVNDSRFQTIGFAYKVDGGETEWVTGSDAYVKERLVALDIPSATLICHHSAFDGLVLATEYGILPKYYVDTLSMSRPITSATVGNSLAALAKKFCLGEKGTEVINAMGVRREDFSPEQLARYGEYCKNDTELTYLLYNILKQWSTPREMYIIDMFIRMYTDPILRLDRKVLLDHQNGVRNRKHDLLSKVTGRHLTGDFAADSMQLMFILNSNPKFAEALRALGVEPPTKTSPVTGKETFAFAKSDPAFKELLEHDNPDVQALVAARLGLRSTIEETRTAALLAIEHNVGRLPVPLSYYGAHTGRASGWDKINLQNLRRGGRLRESIIAPPNYRLVAVDSSQIEARVTAWLAGQTDLVEAFANGEDVYSSFATSVYRYPVSKATHKIERFVGKTGILGLGFGCGAPKFQLMLKNGEVSVDMPIEDCERIVKTYRSDYDKIAKLWKMGQEYLEHAVAGYDYDFGVGIKLHGTPEGIHLPNGMMIRYNDLQLIDGEYAYFVRNQRKKIFGAKVIENVVQALARIVVFDQMGRIDQWLRPMDASGGRRYRVVLTVHDEVVCCVPKDFAPTCLQTMTQIMSTPPKWARDLPVACEGAMGANYAECK